ncbi:type II toxin-antitoxin system VapC family toxin [Pyxidicoccus sp. 3LFB2]
MDHKLLPRSALIDTGVFIRALRERQDKETPDCVDFVEAMLNQHCELIIAAPTLAEILRFKKGQQPPTMHGITVGAFDDEAARILGQKFPEDTLVEFRQKTGNPLHYYKYDALIVACAMRWEVECIVAIDGDIFRLGKENKLRVERPEAFRAKQGRLALVHSPTATPAPDSTGAPNSSLKDSKS